MNGGVGFYGKLPGAGDFVQRRLPPDFVNDWDHHFQSAMETGRREMGERWSTAWRHGAAWRFLLAPHVCGSGSSCGLTGPAADRLGRAFPLVLAAPCAGDVTGIFGNDAWFDALERVYWNAQHRAVSVETFDAQVAALPCPPAGATELSTLWSDLPWDSGQWQLEMPGGVAGGVMLAETWKQLCMRSGPWCLWWTAGAARLLATRGLPRSYAALLDSTASQRPDPFGFADAFPESGVGSAAPATRPTYAGSQTIREDWLLEDAPDGWPDRDVRREPASAFDAARETHATAESSDLLRWFDDGRALVLSADDGPHDPRCVAASVIREAVAASVPDTASQRAALTALHARLHGANQGAAAVTNENGAAIVVRFDGTYAHLLRVGAAALWQWRRGQLQAAFVERPVGAGGEFDDLLFGDAWLNMPGIGTANEPQYEEATLRLEPGDRLLLLVTRGLMQLPRDCLAEALALSARDDVRANLAIRAGLGAQSAQWPLAVVDIRA